MKENPTEPLPIHRSSVQEKQSERPRAVACHSTPLEAGPALRKGSERFLSVRRKRILIAISVFLTPLFCSYLFRSSLLQGAANAWIVDPPAEGKYDIAVVPGGGLQTRPFSAAELFHQDRVEGIVSFLTEVMPSEAMGLTRPSDQVTLEILDKLKVPREKIFIIGDHVTSTRDEVLAVKEWALENDIQSLYIMTEIFSSRRVAWSYDQEFKDSEITTEIFAITPKSYSADNWWQSEQGLIAFQNEFIKYFYYLLKY